MQTNAKEALIKRVGETLAEKMTQEGSAEEALSAIRWVEDSLKRLSRRQVGNVHMLAIFLEGCFRTSDMPGVNNVIMENMAEALRLPLPSNYIKAELPLGRVTIFF